MRNNSGGFKPFRYASSWLLSFQFDEHCVLLDKENHDPVKKLFRNNFGLNRFGRGKNQTESNRIEPKLIGLNPFSVRFGFKTFFLKNRFDYLF